MAAAEKLLDPSGNPIKAALSAYMHFCAERRAGLTAELKAKLAVDDKELELMREHTVLTVEHAKVKKMLLADKHNLQQELKLNLLHIEDKELNYYPQNSYTVGTQAALLAG